MEIFFSHCDCLFKLFSGDIQSSLFFFSWRSALESFFRIPLQVINGRRLSKRRRTYTKVTKNIYEIFIPKRPPILFQLLWVINTCSIFIIFNLKKKRFMLKHKMMSKSNGMQLFLKSKHDYIFSDITLWVSGTTSRFTESYFTNFL